LTGKLKNAENIIKALLDFFSDTFVVVLELDTVIIMKSICVNSFQNPFVCIPLKNKDK